MIRGRCARDGDCLIWTQGTNDSGSPRAHIDGRHVIVRRLLKEVDLGRKLSRKEFACTACDNDRCVSPACTVVKTRAQYLKGTNRYRSIDVRMKIAQTKRARGMSKIKTLEEARDIRLRKLAGESVESLAQSVGMSIGRMRKLLSGEAYIDPHGATR